MDINIYNTDGVINDALVNKLMKLKDIIKNPQPIDIHCISGKYSLLRWLTAIPFNPHASNIIIVEQGIYHYLKNEINNNILIVNNLQPNINIVDDVVKFVINKKSTSSPVDDVCKTTLTPIQANFFCDLFMSTSSTSKTDWNLKRRVKKKMSFKDDYEMYLWWLLSNKLPADMVRRNIKIKNIL